jgi:hypothetical protein
MICFQRGFRIPEYKGSLRGVWLYPPARSLRSPTRRVYDSERAEPGLEAGQENGHQTGFVRKSQIPISKTKLQKQNKLNDKNIVITH